MNTGSRAFCILIALAAGGEVAVAQAVGPGQYSVEAKLVTLPEAEADDLPPGGALADADLGAVAQRDRAHIIAFPNVSSALGNAASVTLTQPMVVADGAKQDVGPSLEIKALADGRFHVAFHAVDFLGYKEPAAIHPRFRSHRVSRNIQPGTAANSSFALIDVTPHSEAPVVYDASGHIQASLADAHERQLLFVKITRG